MKKRYELDAVQITITFTSRHSAEEFRKALAAIAESHWSVLGRVTPLKSPGPTRYQVTVSTHSRPQLQQFAELAAMVAWWEGFTK
jgi:hypothetical protein